MKFFLMLLILKFASASWASNAECYRNLIQYGFTLNTFDNPFNAVGDNGLLIDWDTGKQIAFEINTQNIKSGTYRPDDNNQYSVKFTYEEGRLRKAEGFATNFGSKGNRHVVTFNETCQIIRTYEGNTVRHDAALCKSIQSLGVSKINECHSVMGKFSKIVNDFRKDVEAEGYLYEVIQPKSDTISNLLSAYGRCSNIMGWERSNDQKNKSKKVDSKNIGSEKHSTK